MTVVCCGSAHGVVVLKHVCTSRPFRQNLLVMSNKAAEFRISADRAVESLMLHQFDEFCGR